MLEEKTDIEIAKLIAMHYEDLIRIQVNLQALKAELEKRCDRKLEE